MPNGERKVLMLGPVYGGTGVPEEVPVVVFGEGLGSYCRLVCRIREKWKVEKGCEVGMGRTNLKSQYCVKEPLQKSGQRPCSVHVFLGSTWPLDSSPVYVLQNWVLSTRPP